MARRTTALIATLFAAGFTPSPAGAETRALLIGASHYGSPGIPDLVGPANDITAMEKLARSLGAADLVSLRDAAITRSSVESALQEMGRRARPGDWILFYYTGHGAQVRAASGGGFDQFVPLPGFDLDHQDPEHFIVDKDFYAWLKRYVPADVEILMMVDSCHSGSMHRAVDPRSFAFASRLAFRGEEREIQLVARPGPRLPALQATQDDADGGSRDDLANLVYIGASRDDQLALETELPQEGSPWRGVLTFAFEQGLSTPGSDGAELAADLDGDGHVTVLEITSYLNGQVRMLSAQRQESTAYFPSARADMPLFSALPPPRPPLDMPPPAVQIVAPDPPALPADPPWRIAERADQADFVWDARTGDVLRRSGDVVATQVTSLAALEGVIEKWRTILALSPLVSELNARMLVDPAGSDFLYPTGTPVTLSLGQTERAAASGRRRYATVFNLASDGTVQLLYPLAGDGEGLLPAGGKVSVLETRVVAPFGVDHIVAVTTPDLPWELRAAVRTADGQRASGRLIGLVRADLKRARGLGGLSIAELYTGN